MRVAVLVALMCLSGCASDKLALAPPPGVNFTGNWQLNEADSDDPLRLLQSQNSGSATNAPGSGGQGGQGGQGGRGGRQGRGGGGGGPGGFGGSGGPIGPAMPGVGALGDGLHWPGKNVAIKQVAGVVNITSAGVNRVYRPVNAPKRHERKADDDDSGRDLPARDRGDSPVRCGWDDKTLVVQGDPDDDHPPFDQRYSISADGQRLIEVVSFKGGRSSGYTVSRVWDRVVPGTAPSGAADVQRPAAEVPHN